MSLIKNQKGVSLIQILVISAVVLAMGAGVMRISSTHTKLNQSVLGNVRINSYTQKVTQALAHPRSCTRTLSANLTQKLTVGNIDGDGNKELANGILDQTGNEIIKIITDEADGSLSAINANDSVDNIILRGLKLKSYTPSPGVLSFQKVFLEVKSKGYFQDQNFANESSKQTFSAYERNTIIPILLVSNDDNLVLCVSEPGESALRALIEACTRFGGDPNYADLGICDQVEEDLLRKVTENLCSGAGDTCEHPYRNSRCPGGPDPDGTVFPQNWFVTGFDNAGEYECQCIPTPCRNPALYCAGVDIGTDHCTVDCGVGTQPIVWSPAPSTVCSGTNYTQTRTCDGLTRGAVGTKTTDECAPPCVPSWPAMPDASTICVGASETIYDGCGNSQTVNGTNSDASCVCTASYEPPVTEECSGVVFTQVNSCDASDTRPATGVKTTDECFVPPPAASCTIRAPHGWYGGSGHCVEYFLPIGGDFATYTLNDGEERTLFARYCTMTRGPFIGTVGACNGATMKVRCDNGRATWFDRVCNPHAGDEF